MIQGLLWTIPWVLAALYFVLRRELPPALPPAAPRSDPPAVTVIIPARNESATIGSCLASVRASTYPALDVIVVDDESQDDTADIVRRLADESSDRSRVPVRLLAGKPLPAGWFGKPWACWQGAQDARGDFLLFTDADTIHTPDLVARSVEAIEQARADVLSLVARQLMESFWERAVQPQIFLLLLARFPNLAKDFNPTLRDPTRWRHALANGQFMLFRRESYDRLGGHRRVKGEVVEDLRLAQEIVRDGMGLALFDAPEALSTRMYRSLKAILEGWIKNLSTAARQTTTPIVGTLLVAAAAPLCVGFGVLPPLGVALSLAGFGDAAFAVWAWGSTLIGVMFWMAAAREFRIPLWSGLLFAPGALVSAYILVVSVLRGDRIRWKARDYRGA